MALIKLTALAHPDLAEGKAWPVYVDASRVLLVSRSSHQFVKIEAQGLKREVYDDMWAGAQRLTKLLNEKMPNEIDTQEAAKWTRDMHILAHDLQACHNAWSQAYRAEDFHPRQECTEVQLACGTALEHGVMLTRIMVTETPDEVARAVNPFGEGSARYA